MDSKLRTPTEVFAELVKKKRVPGVKEEWHEFLAYMKGHGFSTSDIHWVEVRIKEGVLENRGRPENVEQFDNFCQRPDVLLQLEDFIYYRGFDTDLDL